MPLERLVGLIKARGVCNQAHQQTKEELDLDHFEGRSWHGLHHCALMVMIATAFLPHRRLAEQRQTRPGKHAAPYSGAATIAKPACGVRGTDRDASATA